MTDATMIEVLRRHLAERPDKIAFRFVDKRCETIDTLTFATLDRRARAIASILVDRGMGGRRIVLSSAHGPGVVAALLGCFHAGAVAVVGPAADQARGTERLRAIVADADAACLLGDVGAIDADVGRDVARIDLRTTDIDPADFTSRATGPGDPAVLQYTSGSTGNPRAVLLTHANIVHNERMIYAALDGSPEDSAVCWLPLYHDMGLIGGVLQALYAGSTCTMMAPLAFLQQPLRWLRAISRFRATVSMAPSFAYELCARFARHPDAASLDLSAWRVAICGGEAVRPAGLERFAEAFASAGFDARALFPSYGLAEATLMATASRAGEGMRSRMVGGRRIAACGRPGPGHAIAIVDPARAVRVPPGEAGEIWLRGPSIAVGYWRRPEDTAETFGARIAGEALDTRWLRTGDLGALTDDGLVVTGRIKDLIVVRGANLDPQDIEQAAVADPALRDAAAFAVAEDDGGQIVVACEVARESVTDLRAGDVVGTITAAMSRDFGLTLHDVVFVRPGTLPRTTSGKLQRHLCRAQYNAGRLAALPRVDHPALGRCRPTPTGSA